jgi:hypothetical protein
MKTWLDQVRKENEQLKAELSVSRSQKMMSGTHTYLRVAPHAAQNVRDGGSGRVRVRVGVCHELCGGALAGRGAARAPAGSSRIDVHQHTTSERAPALHVCAGTQTIQPE